jgi:hypothetical protein
MTKKKIVISDQAVIDMCEIEAYIKDVLKSPVTAAGYMKGISDTIQKLSYVAAAVGTNEYVQNIFGANARHVVFKKMAIIFFSESDAVRILRIIPCSLIY